MHRYPIPALTFALAGTAPYSNTADMAQQTLSHLPIHHMQEHTNRLLLDILCADPAAGLAQRIVMLLLLPEPALLAHLHR